MTLPRVLNPTKERLANKEQKEDNPEVDQRIS
jgi:hypothetical protein